MPPQNKLNLTFDISALAVWHNESHGKRGIYRVVDSLLEVLAPNCNTSLSSTENSPLGITALRSRNYLQDVGFHDNKIHQGLGIIANKLAEFSQNNIRDHDTNGKFSRKVSRWSSVKIAVAAAPLAAIHSNFDLSKVNIFHQPGRFRIPSFIRSHKASAFARFMTIYDFIPFLAEGKAGHEAPSLKKVFKSLSKDDFLICISHHVKQEACERLGFPEDQVFVAPLAASTDIFYRCSDPTRIKNMRQNLSLGEKPYFLSLSAVEPRKNIQRLIEGFAALCKQQRSMDANLVLAGSVSHSSLKSLTELVRTLGLNGRVFFLGYIADEMLAPLYSEALAFVFPSLAEGFGLPPLEAMQCGTPVISSSFTSLPEVVGDAGVLVNPLENESFSAAMWDLYSNETTRKTLSRLGLNRATTFSWEQCAQDHLQAYYKALSM